jgi:hypothetical protein
MGLLILLLLAFIIYALYKIALQQSTAVVSNWHHLFKGTPISPQSFYQIVEELIEERQLSQIQLSRITYVQAGLFSARREYLRVKYKEYLFDICAAPFAKNLFVSWWLSELGSPLFDLCKRIPVIGLFVTKRAKTFFELDTENMFKECIQECVNIAVSQVTEMKGQRKFAEGDFTVNRNLTEQL